MTMGCTFYLVFDCSTDGFVFPFYYFINVFYVITDFHQEIWEFTYFHEIFPWPFTTFSYGKPGVEYVGEHNDDSSVLYLFFVPGKVRELDGRGRELGGGVERLMEG